MNKKLFVVNNTITYIEDHLAGPLDLTCIADAVHYSKYYLHRSFTETTGMTIHTYIQRRRLTEAACLLTETRLPLMQIAQQTGYETQQAFTAVFKSMYKLPPRRFRAAGAYYPLQLRLTLPDTCPTDIEGLRITTATETDIPAWMHLLTQTVDAFPCLDESAHVQSLKTAIHQNQACLLTSITTTIPIAAMILTPQTGHINYLTTHPLHRTFDLHKPLLTHARRLTPSNTPLTITTYRQNDKADTGHRTLLKTLGFTPTHLLTEYGYPTQQFIL